MRQTECSSSQPLRFFSKILPFPNTNSRLFSHTHTTVDLWNSLAGVSGYQFTLGLFRCSLTVGSHVWWLKYYCLHQARQCYQMCGWAGGAHMQRLQFLTHWLQDQIRVHELFDAWLPLLSLPVSCVYYWIERTTLKEIYYRMQFKHFICKALKEIKVLHNEETWLWKQSVKNRH